MTNAPIVLTQDCDMYSNDPKTPQQMLCFYLDESIRYNLGYIQFPQRFHGINKADIYSSEYKRLYVINPGGMDGLKGPCYVGSGCFFVRRVFFGGPSSPELPEVCELWPDHVVKKPIKSQEIVDLAHGVACSNYENNSSWGSKVSQLGSIIFLACVINLLNNTDCFVVFYRWVSDMGHYLKIFLQAFISIAGDGSHYFSIPEGLPF